MGLDQNQGALTHSLVENKIGNPPRKGPETSATLNASKMHRPQLITETFTS